MAGNNRKDSSDATDTDTQAIRSRLKEGQERLEILFEHLADAIYICKPDGQLVQVNEQACLSTGYTREELLAKNITDFDAEVTTAEALREFVDTLLPGQPTTLESKHRRKDGSTFPVEITISLFETPSGLNILGIARDITARRRLEQNYQTLFRKMLNGFALHEIICDAQGKPVDYRFLIINPAFERMTDLREQDIIGKTVMEVMPGIEPYWIETYGKVALTGEPVFFENYSQELGKHFEVMAFRPMPNQFACIFADITDRKRAEERLQAQQVFTDTIVQSMPGLFYIFEKSSARFVRRNDNWTKITGYSNDELDMMTALEFFEKGEDRDLCAQRMQEVYDRGSSSMENRFVSKSGEQIPYYFTGNKLVIDDKTYLVGMGLDISERKQAEDERERLVKMLEFKNRELQDIAYSASHDLKSPLVNIEGFSNVLKTDCDHLIGFFAEQAKGQNKTDQIELLLKKDIPESLGFIIRSTKKMATLLDGLLQVSRVGSIEINSEFLDMDKIARNVLTAMEHQINQSKATIAVDSLPGCLGDAHMVDHVLTNLVGNAVKYLDPAKKGEIRISGKVEGDVSIYCVTDNGIGIAPEHQKKVFEIFHRLDPEGFASGDGLGLTIVARIMDRLGGQVWLESEQGRGSKFFVSLPTVKT